MAGRWIGKRAERGRRRVVCQTSQGRGGEIPSAAVQNVSVDHDDVIALRERVSRPLQHGARRRRERLRVEFDSLWPGRKRVVHDPIAIVVDPVAQLNTSVAQVADGEQRPLEQLRRVHAIRYKQPPRVGTR